jgi:predicted RNA-binding Zn-ribbon protein involved in translation (DUF1610 family)
MAYQASCAVCGIGVSGNYSTVGYVCIPCGTILVDEYKAYQSCSCSSYYGSDYVCFGLEGKKDSSMRQAIEYMKRDRAGLCQQCGERHK